LEGGRWESLVTWKEQEEEASEKKTAN